MNDEKSLVAAIEGDLSGMSKENLVLTCEMLERGRAAWRKDAEDYRATLVMLRRELDTHSLDDSKYEFPKSVWQEVLRRHGGA